MVSSVTEAPWVAFQRPGYIHVSHVSQARFVLIFMYENWLKTLRNMSKS